MAILHTVNREQDSFGQALWAAFKGEATTVVIERDDRFVDPFENVGQYLKDEMDWPAGEKQAIKLARGRVLDIGCGAGRHALHLQKLGHAVTGIDNSPLAIRVCRARGLTGARVMPIRSIGRFPAGTFDTVIMFGNNFGLFGSFQGARRLLRILHRITRPGAVLLAASNDIYRTKDPLHLKYHAWNRRRGRMSGQIRFRVRYRQFVGKWMDYLMVSRKEMEKLLAGTGWKVRRFVHGEFSSYYIGVVDRQKIGR